MLVESERSDVWACDTAGAGHDTWGGVDVRQRPRKQGGGVGGGEEGEGACQGRHSHHALQRNASESRGKKF